MNASAISQFDAALDRGDELFGRKRLREAVRASAGAGCAELHEAILAAVRGFTGGAPQSDDLTLVVLEYQGS